MYEDVPTSNIPNKVRVIELVNENVISFQSSYLEKFRTPGTKVLGVFFMEIQKINFLNPIIKTLK